MKRTFRFRLFLLVLPIVLTVSCTRSEKGDDLTRPTAAPTITVDQAEPSLTSAPTPSVFVPSTSAELMDHIALQFTLRQFSEIYRFSSTDLATTLDQASFCDLLSQLYSLGGALQSETHSLVAASTADTYQMLLHFENIDAKLTLGIKDTQLSGIQLDYTFRDSFEITHNENVVERYFNLESENIRLKAVFTYINDGQKHPTALLVAGSGPSDYNETAGILKPFEDLALSLAAQGIQSLRVDKRTIHSEVDFPVTGGLEQEYFIDCETALAYIDAQDNVSSVFLIGHSLGGQIIPQLATRHSNIDGLILYNSTPRHLATLIVEQVEKQMNTSLPPYRIAAKVACDRTLSDCTGESILGVSDYYWASYNTLNVVDDLKSLQLPTLIFNSTADLQIFSADTDAWSDAFRDSPYATIVLDDKMSHLGYEIDLSDTTSYYHSAELPSRLIRTFADFIYQNEP